MEKDIEQQRQEVADQLNIPLKQVEVLSEAEQQAGAIEQQVETTTEEQQVKEFLASEENRQHALQLAEQIQHVCGDKWFTLEKLLKKSAETRQTGFQKLKLCEMFGLLATRIGDWRDDRKQLRETLYKIMISPVDRIAAIDRIITYHSDQIDKMRSERNILYNKLPKIDSSDAFSSSVKV